MGGAEGKEEVWRGKEKNRGTDGVLFEKEWNGEVGLEGRRGR